MLCLCGRKSALGKAALCRCFAVLRHSAAVLLPCYANRCYAIATQVYTVPLDAMPLRSYAHLFPANASRSLAIPRPSCSSLSYATAELIPALLLLWISAPCVLCLSSAIPSSSMLLLCGRSFAILCPRIVPLCYAIAAQSLAFPLLLIAKPLPCLPLPRHAMPLPIAALLRFCFVRASHSWPMPLLCL